MTQSTFHPPPGVQQPYGQPYGQPAPGPYGAPPPGFGHPQPPTKKKRTGLIVGSVIGALVLLGGAVVGAIFLFGSKTLDRADAQHEVARLGEQLVGVAPEDVRCPADVEVQAGATFRCTATVDGQDVSFTVTQKDDQGNVEVATGNTYYAVADIESRVGSVVEEQTDIDVTATCDADGRTVLVDPDGGQLSCTVTNTADSSDTLDVTATVASDGTVSVEG